MKIQVIGKAHLEGTSRKTGKPYNFNQIHYNAPDRGVEGLAALTLTLDPSIIPYGSISVGDTYEVEFGPRGFIVAFTAVRKQ